MRINAQTRNLNLAKNGAMPADNTSDYGTTLGQKTLRHTAFMKTLKNPTFPIIIAVLSLVVLYKFIFQTTDIYGLISVIVGITGIIFYYKGHRKYDAFFYAWVYLQLPNIYLITKTGMEIPFVNAFPGVVFPLNLGVGLNLTLKGGSQLIIYLNLLPMGLYYLLKYLNVDKPLGRNISIGRLRKGTFPQIQFPVTGTIEKVSGRNKLTAVYQVNLDNEIQINDKRYKYILLDPKDNSLIQVTDKKQICGLRLCETPDLNYTDKQNPFADWVTVDCV